LNSGKFGATFPGAFSARTYLKIMAHDCQNLLYAYCEPLASLAYLCGRPYPAQCFESISRLLLQNGVHDCICGVSIDQVHEKMGWSYQNAFNELLEILQDSLRHIMQSFAPGEYAISTHPFCAECWLPVEDSLLRLQTSGIGIWRVAEKIPIDTSPHQLEEGASFPWHNDHYAAILQTDGLVRLGEAVLGELRVYRENGDTYSDERGDLLGIMCPVTPLKILETSDRHAVLEIECAWKGKAEWVTARIRLIFDPSSLLRFQIELDSCGTDLCVEMCFATAHHGEIWAGMPFDMVQRPEADVDLLPRQLTPPLSNILLGQRELGEVRTFPFHDMVAISDKYHSAAVFARGLHAYRVEKGVIALTLRRSVEWLTRPNLARRVGDAGPFFYVPDARSERKVQHELAFAALPFPAASMELQALNASFQNPPLVVRSEVQGRQDQWDLLQEDIPLSALRVQEDALLARFFNPTSKIVELSHAYAETDVWGQVQGMTKTIGPKKIAVLKLANPRQDTNNLHGLETSPIFLLNMPHWRVGESHASPDPAILAQLEQKISVLDEQIEEVTKRLALIQTEGEKDQNLRLRLQHQRYALQRERLEYQLSLLLNQRKLGCEGNTPLEMLSQIDPQIASVGKELNRLRIKRRIYDYVVQVLD
jgi:alpha-mannosidase